MDQHRDTQLEVARLEQLWSGEFGNDYVDRNRSAGDYRKAFWDGIISTYQPSSALEIGCNVGANLRWIARRLPPHHVYGVDVNLKALKELHEQLPAVNGLWAPGRELPLRDRWFDMVFTMGVLIHQPRATLPLVMAEVVRCSRRLVLCGEYYAPQLMEVPYRGHSGALFKDDYGAMYQRLFPELALLEKGFLSREEGWDDVTYWVFENRSA